METFYIFLKSTGAFIGTRGTAPETDSGETGVLETTETLTALTACIIPKLVKGQIVEGATAEQIEAHNRASVPSPISKMRFFLQLLNLGITRQMVYDLVNAIPDEKLREMVLIKLDYSQEFDRTDPHLIMMAENFGMTSEQLDQLFIAGNQ
jgi:hypothetical protein